MYIIDVVVVVVVDVVVVDVVVVDVVVVAVVVDVAVDVVAIVAVIVIVVVGGGVEVGVDFVVKEKEIFGFKAGFRGEFVVVVVEGRGVKEERPTESVSG